MIPQGVRGGEYTCLYTPGSYANTGNAWSCDYAGATASTSAIQTLTLLCSDGTTSYTGDRATFSCPRADVVTG